MDYPLLSVLPYVKRQQDESVHMSIDPGTATPAQEHNLKWLVVIIPVAAVVLICVCLRIRDRRRRPKQASSTVIPHVSENGLWSLPEPPPIFIHSTRTTQGLPLLQFHPALSQQLQQQVQHQHGLWRRYATPDTASAAIDRRRRTRRQRRRTGSCTPPPAYVRNGQDPSPPSYEDVVEPEDEPLASVRIRLDDETPLSAHLSRQQQQEQQLMMHQDDPSCASA